MPLYEYRCQTCSYTFERIERPSAMSSQACPECGGEAKRQLGVPALQFKGSGWYVTDYAKKSTPATTSNGSSSSKDGSKGSSETKSTGSSESSGSKTSSADTKSSAA